jgi:cytochrome c6
MKISLGSVLRRSRPGFLAAIFLMAALSLQSAGSPSETGSDRVRPKFKSSCASCHGMDGSGTPLGKSMDAPDLRSEAVQKHSDAELAQIIADGKKDMPSFKKTFTEEQIRGLVQYVRELVKNKAPAEK